MPPAASSRELCFSSRAARSRGGAPLVLLPRRNSLARSSPPLARRHKQPASSPRVLPLRSVCPPPPPHSTYSAAARFFSSALRSSRPSAAASGGGTALPTCAEPRATGAVSTSYRRSSRGQARDAGASSPLPLTRLAVHGADLAVEPERVREPLGARALADGHDAVLLRVEHLPDLRKEAGARRHRERKHRSTSDTGARSRGAEGSSTRRQMPRELRRSLPPWAGN